MSQNSDVSASSKPAILVNRSSLRSLRARPTLDDYLVKLWQTRFFIWRDARAKAMAEGRGTFLGMAWIILNPAIQVGLYAFIFGYIMKTNRGVENFIGFLIIGVTFFNFLSAGLNSGSLLIQRNRNLINSFSFPKAAVVVSTGIRMAIDNVPAAVLAVGFALFSQFHKKPSWTVLLVPIVYLMMHLFIIGVIFIVARLTAFVPDVKSLLTIVTRILFFTSGVFWPIERFVHHPTVAKVMSANPFHQFLASTRTLVLDGSLPSSSVWLTLVLWTICTFVFGLVFFWRSEHLYATVK